MKPHLASKIAVLIVGFLGSFLAHITPLPFDLIWGLLFAIGESDQQPRLQYEWAILLLPVICGLFYFSRGLLANVSVIEHCVRHSIQNL